MSDLKYYTTREENILVIVDEDNHLLISMSEVRGILYEDSGIAPGHIEITYDQANAMREKFAEIYRRTADLMDSAF